MRSRISARIQEPAAGQVPFVHAVVVRARIPTSVRAGDDAIVLSDGSIEGFVGGQWAESSVRTAALGAPRDRRSVLLRVLPEGGEPFPDSPIAESLAGALDFTVRRVEDPAGPRGATAVVIAGHGRDETGSIAEIIAEIRDHGLRSAEPGRGSPAEPEAVEVTDPVCGMTVTVTADTPHAVVEGGAAS
jgi:xanthine dehydrogenase accessory factor